MGLIDAILRLPKVILDIADISEELRDLRSAVVEIKCEIARQGEELDVLYDKCQREDKRSR
jgi:uncharacterized coiled-coil protein SlyX